MNMENRYTTVDEQTIDLARLFREVIKNFYIVILVAFIGALFGGVVLPIVKPVEYTATAKIYTTTQEAAKSNFVELADSGNAIKQTILKLETGEKNYEGIEYSTLASNLSVSFLNTSNVCQLSVTNKDPYIACDLANTHADTVVEYVTDITGVEGISITETAEVPNVSNSGSASKNAVLGAVIGFILAVCIICAVYLIRGTIRTRDDIENYLGIETLAVIPTAKGRKRKARMISKAQGGKR